MQFPSCLISKNRKPYPEEKIHYKNYMYARHKPGSDWKEGDELPDLSKIRSQQSFNWSAFSIPVWTRFDDKRKYLPDYGVMGYSVNIIKKAHIYDLALPENAYGLRHNPIKYNYSHCELYPINILNNKKAKREFGYLLKINCKRKILPNSKVNKLTNLYEYFIMLCHRIIMLLG